MAGAINKKKLIKNGGRYKTKQESKMAVAKKQNSKSKMAVARHLFVRDRSPPLRQQGAEGAGGGSARQPRVDERGPTHHVVHEEPLPDIGGLLILSWSGYNFCANFKTITYEIRFTHIILYVYLYLLSWRGATLVSRRYLYPSGSFESMDLLDEE